MSLCTRLPTDPLDKPTGPPWGQFLVQQRSAQARSMDHDSDALVAAMLSVFQVAFQKLPPRGRTEDSTAEARRSPLGRAPAT